MAAYSYLKMNKKGASVVDLFLLVLVLFAMSMATIFGYKIFSDLNTDFQANDDLPAVAKTQIQDAKDSYVGVFDGVFTFILVGLGLALFVGAFFLNSHPVFFIFAVILAALAILVGAIFTNVYEEVAAQDEISAIEGEFTVIPFVFNNFAVVIAVLALLLLVGLFAKSRVGDGPL